MIVPLSEDTGEKVVSDTKHGFIIGMKKLCPHCKNMEKVLVKCAQKLPGVAILGIDVEDCLKLKDFYNIDRVPTILFIHEGKVADRFVGLTNYKEIINLYQKAGASK